MPRLPLLTDLMLTEEVTRTKSRDITHRIIMRGVMVRVSLNKGLIALKMVPSKDSGLRKEDLVREV
jgi:hypothetical protein